MDKKAFPFEIKADGEKRTFEGYASTWKKDLVNDMITQGAFRKSITERFPKNQIKVLWQHYDPIGLPTHMEEDSKGLFVVGKISKTSLGDDALTLMKDGVIDTMSIGYDVVKDSLSDDGSTRLLHELKLYEFSPVTFPANPDTAVTAVKKAAMMGIDFDIEELTKLIKAGRMLSATNLDKLRTMMAELNELITTAEPLSSTLDTTPEPPKGIQIFDSIFTEMKNYGKR